MFELGAAAPVDYHTGQISVDDVKFVVEIEHRDGRHFSGCATGACRSGRIGLLDDVRVRILLEENVRALPCTVVGLVLFRGDDPIPSELDKVHRQRIATATGLGRCLVAVEPDRTLRSMLPPVRGNYLHKRHLRRDQFNLNIFHLILLCSWRIIYFPEKVTRCDRSADLYRTWEKGKLKSL